MERFRGPYFERKPEVHPDRKHEVVPNVPAQDPKKTPPRSYEQIKAILPVFKEAYMGRPLVIGTGLGAETTRQGLNRIVLCAYLSAESTKEQQRKLKKTFRGVPVRYEVTGPVVAAESV